MNRDNLKTRIEQECDDFVKVNYSGKPEWLIVKTLNENRTMASIRVGKANITLNIDTKSDSSLDIYFGRTEGLKVTTTPKVNHNQNKINVGYDYYGLVPVILTVAFKSNLCHLETFKDRSTKELE
ncbi:hypothetical protein [Paenibacillus sp. Marseille-Q7038]